MTSGGDRQTALMTAEPPGAASNGQAPESRRELYVCNAHHDALSDPAPETIAGLLADTSNILWLDIANPNQHDAALLRDVFKFHHLAIEDAFHDKQRPKVDTYTSFYLVVFYAAHYAEEEGRIALQELDLFVGRNFLVSVHSGRLHLVQETIDRWRAPDSPIENRVAALLYTLLDAIVDGYFPLIDRVAERIEDLEDQIFKSFDDEAIETIFALKKDLLALRRAVAPERDVLNVLLRREIPVFQASDLVYLQDLYDHIVRVTDSIDTYRDLLSSALDSFLSLQSNKLNQIVKVLTIASIILMSSSLIAGIYGMNFDIMPELRWPLGYPFALGLMLAVSGALYLLFRRMKWI